MIYNILEREIICDRKLSELDKLVVDFIKILEKHTDYVIISGYVSIILGRSRATEDVDIFIKKMPLDNLIILIKDLELKGFTCLNSDNPLEIYSYLNDKLAVRFSRVGKPIPNFELKFPNKRLDEDSFNEIISVKINSSIIKISSLERQIAFKKYYLKSEKDIEDAIHIEELFKKKLDYNKIENIKKLIESL